MELAFIPLSHWVPKPCFYVEGGIQSNAGGDQATFGLLVTGSIQHQMEEVNYIYKGASIDPESVETLYRLESTSEVPSQGHKYSSQVHAGKGI